jgi:hypothetical protein
MAEDEVPKLADWLAEYRSRPEPVEVIVATFDLLDAIPDEPHRGMAAGQVGIDIVRYDAPGWPGPPDDSHYVMGVDGDGEHLWATGTSRRRLHEAQ